MKNFYLYLLRFVPRVILIAMIFFPSFRLMAAVEPPPDFITKWGSPGSDDGQFNYPQGVATDSAGNVYVADTFNQRIQKFNAAGNFLSKLGSSGWGDGQFRYPYGVTVDSAGNVYVADTSNQRIQKFNAEGNFLTKWGSSGRGDGQFYNPYGVAVDSADNVYVTDTNNHRIQKFGRLSTEVEIDIKPQSCPNPLNVKSKGVLPVAILGSESIDVTTIDVSTILLRRKDSEDNGKGVAPIRSNVEDVSGLSEPLGDPQDACACTARGIDGYPDLTLKFDTQEVVKALGTFTDREIRTLTLTGKLNDGNPTMIQGTDCVIILSKGSKGYEGIKVKGGNFTRLDFIDPSTISESEDRPGNLIYDLIDMEIEVDEPGATAIVTVSLPGQVPTEYGWYKYSPNRSWYDFSANAVFNAARDQVTITLTDGDIGDDDGLANGTIVDPSGLGTANFSNGGDPSSVGSGCFIATAAYGSRMAKEVNVLKKVRDEYLLTNELGRDFVSAYYRYSPRLADWIAKHPRIRKIVRIGLYPIMGLSKWLVGGNPSK